MDGRARERVRSSAGQCVGKIAHETLGAAQRQIRQINSRRRQKGFDGELRAYRCPVCSGYHIGRRRELG